MAAEIVILSGARQGERLVLDVEQFRAGDEPACEVYFNPALDPGARGRMILFRHRDDGWYVLPLGTHGLLLDYDPLNGDATIRSGQVVRMSADGPDFSFRVVTTTEAAKQPASPPSTSAAAPQPVVPAPPADVLQVLAAAATGPALPGLAPAPPLAPLQKMPLHVAYVLTGLGLVLLMLALGWWAFRSSHKPEPPPVVPSPLAQTVVQTSATPEPKAAPPAPQPQAAIADPFAAAKQAVFLIQLEQTLPDGSTARYPYATCWAVSARELLTTGNVGCELLRSRAQKFKVYATRPQEQIEFPVTEVRIHRDFLAHETDRQQRRYCDLALLAIDGRLPAAVPLATRAELSPPALEEGVRLTLVGYPHDGNKITAHDRFAAQTFAGKVFVIRAFAPRVADTALCLDLVGQLPAHAYGFGAFTLEGKLLGIYNEPPDEAEAHGMQNLHIVTAVHPEQVERGLRQRDEQQWVEPRVREAPAKETQL